MVWNGSSWMEVNQVEPEFQKASKEEKKNGLEWIFLDGSFN